MDLLHQALIDFIRNDNHEKLTSMEFDFTEEKISCQVDLKLAFAFIGASNNTEKGIDLMNRSSSQINMASFVNNLVLELTSYPPSSILEFSSESQLIALYALRGLIIASNNPASSNSLSILRQVVDRKQYLLSICWDYLIRSNNSPLGQFVDVAASSAASSASTSSSTPLQSWLVMTQPNHFVQSLAAYLPLWSFQAAPSVFDASAEPSEPSSISISESSSPSPSALLDSSLPQRRAALRLLLSLGACMPLEQIYSLFKPSTSAVRTSSSASAEADVECKSNFDEEEASWCLFQVLLEGQVTQGNISNLDNAGMTQLLVFALGLIAPPSHFSNAWAAGAKVSSSILSSNSDDEADDSTTGIERVRHQEFKAELRRRRRFDETRGFNRQSERGMLTLNLLLSIVLKTQSSSSHSDSVDVAWPSCLKPILAPLCIVLSAYSAPAIATSSSITFESLPFFDRWRSHAARLLCSSALQRLASIVLISLSTWPAISISESRCADIPVSVPSLDIITSSSGFRKSSIFFSVFDSLSPWLVLLRWSSVLQPVCQHLRLMLQHGFAERRWRHHPYLRHSLAVILGHLVYLSPIVVESDLHQFSSQLLSLTQLPSQPQLFSALPDLIPALLLLLDDDDTYSAEEASELANSAIAHPFFHQSLALHALTVVLRVASPAESTWFRGLLLHSLRKHLTLFVSNRQDSFALTATGGQKVGIRVVLEPMAACLLMVAFGAAGCCRPPLLDTVKPANPSHTEAEQAATEFELLFECVLKEFEYLTFTLNDASLDAVEILGETLCRLLDGLGLQSARYLSPLLQSVNSLLQTEEFPLAQKGVSSSWVQIVHSPSFMQAHFSEDALKGLICFPLAIRILERLVHWIPSRVVSHAQSLVFMIAHAFSRLSLRHKYAEPRPSPEVLAQFEVMQESLLTIVGFILQLCHSDQTVIDQLKEIIAEMKDDSIPELIGFFERCSVWIETSP